ncbi:MAG: type II toxin-antitoxin system RelE/ParE family toxin [Desulfobulbaceae bacterium]|nr:type II toxin-antitoxin system RelE/ParE family toxin [Desulfobulbaceae bacterium]
MSRKYQVIWSKTAYADLTEIIKYIAQDSPTNAQKILKTIRDTAANLNFSPQSGRVVPELQDQGITQYQELILNPWRLMYKINADTVFVLSVIDSRQNVEDILLGRLTR